MSDKLYRMHMTIFGRYSLNLGWKAIIIIGFVGFDCVFGSGQLQQRKDNTWDYLVFTQQWPEAACTDIKDKGETCEMNSGINSWTIHGIWPNKIGGHAHGPFYCNKSLHFNEQAIVDLEPQLETQWPNMISSESRTSFWKHEWEKHGTCAMTLPALGSEHKYFGKALELNSKLNLKLILAQSGIVPSDSQTYTMPDIRRVVEDYTVSSTIIQCIVSEDNLLQAIIQLEICLNKDFTSRNCEDEWRRHFPRKLRWSPRRLPHPVTFKPGLQLCSDKRATVYLPPHSAFVA